MAGDEHPNDIFIVGDAHQRIYKNKANLSKCGINVRGRSSYLKINYRTTEEIRKYAFGLQFFAAAGVNVGVAYGLRAAAQQLLKLIPVAGWAGSGGLAAAGTYAIRKSAEAYFFAGEIKKPEEFNKQWK